MLERMRYSWLILVACCSAALAQRVPLPELAVPGALGVNIHFTDPRPGEMQMIADGGFRILRMDFSWGGTERKAGVYDFAAYDRLLAAAKPHGMRLLFILDYSNRLYDEGLSPHTPAGRAAMAKWAAAAASHFKGQGILWEMWNEPNIKQFWKPQPNVADYAQLAVEVGKAIRSAAPDELYFGPATSTIDLKFLEACFKAGCLDYWDAVSVHPYRQSAPETAAAEYARLRTLIDQHKPAGKAIPILSGEWGYSAAWKQYDADRQGKYLPRQWLINLEQGVPVSIWYDWHDDGPDPKEAEHHFGTVLHPYLKDQTPPYEPKPAYLAARTLTSQLTGFSFARRVSLDSKDDYVLEFSRGDERRWAVWTTGQNHEVELPIAAASLRATGHLGGEAVELKSTGRTLKVTLRDAPQYLKTP